MRPFVSILALATFIRSAACSSIPFLDEQAHARLLGIELLASETPGNVKAIITNHGVAPAYFSSWRNVLSKHDLDRKINVFSTTGDEVQFLNLEGWPRTDAAESSYERLAAGTSVIREIDIASNYDLQPEEIYSVQASGNMPYYLDSNHKQTKSLSYESNLLNLTAPRDLIRTNLRAALSPAAESYLLAGCDNPTIATKLKNSLPIAAAMVKKAADYTSAGKSGKAFVAYFKTDNAERRATVAARYTAMYKSFTSNTGPVKFSCKKECTGYYARGAAWTGVTDGNTLFCPQMATRTYPDTVKRCDRANFPGVLIHELSHSMRVYSPSTGDKAQGPTACKNLNEAQSITNADTFSMYAQSIYLDTVC